MTRNRPLLALVISICALAAPAAAHASFPGKNGPLIVAIADDCQSFNRYLARIPWRGGDPVSITERCDPAAGDDPAQHAPGYFHPDAAPDGRSILAGRNGPEAGFVTLRPDGSDLTPVPLPTGVAKNGLGSMPAPSFARTGRKFAFEADHYRDGHDVEPLWEVRLDGSGARRIRKAMDCNPGNNCSTMDNPRLSPDGKLIAVEVTSYVYKPSKPRAMKSGIWLVLSKNGKPVRRLTKHGFDVDWSPDGRNIVYRTHYQQQEVGGGASGGNLYVVSRDGKRKRTLVHRHGIAETQPAWSPDGRWITWVSMDFTGGDVGFDVFPSLWTVRASGGRPRLIQKLPEPYVEEGEFSAPQLTWLPAPN